MAADFAAFYPLRPGAVWVYLYRDPELPGGSAAAFARRRVVSARRTDEGLSGTLEERVETPAGARTRTFDVLLSSEGIREEGRWILRGEPVLGNSWHDGPDLWRVAALGQTVSVPAGEFPGCLLLTYQNEDTGGGALLLAPGLGPVRAEQHGERGPFLYELKETAGF